MAEGKITSVFDEKTKAELLQALKGLVGPVRIVHFTQKIACPGCSAQNQLLLELANMSKKIVLDVYHLEDDPELAAHYKVDKVPATLVLGQEDNGIRFYGLTLGYEFPSLLSAIIMVSTSKSGLPSEVEEMVKKIGKDVHVQVFVTLTCPYCPNMVHVAHQFAFVNHQITADMVESSEFPQLVQRYGVQGVPKTVINEAFSFDGAVPASTLYMRTLKAVDPDLYRKLDEVIRESEGTRKAKKADPAHKYEVLIIGAGPAAMSAALYAARKGLDVALIAAKVGGQMTYTGNIDNYLGFPSIRGGDLTEVFVGHMERYPISEAFDSPVVDVAKEGDSFIVRTEDGRKFSGSSVVYCAGKEYRRLGVANEERFIGKGIAFCADCDAPLYQDKRIAVIGGGNSAFTSARDLIRFARELHLVHRKTNFTADELLVDLVLGSDKVIVHTPMIVDSFLGNERLTGVRLSSVGGDERTDLSVEGVFLEIGLSPNSSPIRDLVDMNDIGEVVAAKDQSTKTPGLFVAGDVTEVKEKQISVSVGQGAVAAISAYEYLSAKGLTQSRAGIKEDWQ
jgi:NADH-dependent peroxiredoxin subunit F